jgi:hypothetical protein
LALNLGSISVQKCVKAWERAVNKLAQSWTYPVPTCVVSVVVLVDSCASKLIKPVVSKNETGAKNNVSRPTVVVDSYNAVLR